MNQSTVLSSHSEFLGTITAKDLVKVIATKAQQPVSIDDLGQNPPHQLVVMAYFIVDEKAKTKKLSEIVLKEPE